jgi:DNA polymerase V
VWGVGRQIGAQLQAQGVHTALDLQRMAPAVARARWSVVLEKTVRELQGVPCFGFEDQPPPKQQIACTRSFGQPVTQWVDLQAAVTEFACRAAEKLRRQSSHAGRVMVFIRTSPTRAFPSLQALAILGRLRSNGPRNRCSVLSPDSSLGVWRRVLMF